MFIDRLGQPCARTDKIGSETELEREQWLRFAAISYLCNKLCRGLHSAVFPPFFPFVFVPRRWRQRRRRPRRRRRGSWFLPWQKVAKRDKTRCGQIFEEPCRLLHEIQIDKSAYSSYFFLDLFERKHRDGLIVTIFLIFSQTNSRHIS